MRRRRKYAPKGAGSAFFLPGVGYLTRDEERLVKAKARELAPLVEVGFLTPEEARERILEALRRHRKMQWLRTGK